MANPKVAYIGLDHLHCQAYLQTIDQLPVDLVGACESNESFDVESVDGVGDIPIYTDPETLFEAETIDIAWVSTSNKRTPAILELAARNQVDVYAEKPLAKTAEDLEPIVDSIQPAPMTVVAGYQNRGAAPAKQIRELIRDDFFGELQAVELRMITSQLQYRDQASDLYDRAAGGGGILQWLGCHYIDMIQWLLDEPIVRVNAKLRHGTDSVDIEDGASIQFEMSSGAIGTLTTGYYDREYDLHVGIHGTDGRVQWDPTGGGSETDIVEYECYGERWTESLREVSHQYDSVPGYGGAIGYDYMMAFLEARTGDRSALDYVATIEEALDVLRILDAAYKSAEANSWCEVQ